MLVPLVNDHVALIPTKAVGKMVFEIDNECWVFCSLLIY
jgi:hypothetical protein